jgi:tartrate-resistant acid phosphatase type 5
MRIILIYLLIVFLPARQLCAQSFAVIGDFGWNNQNEQDVADLVKGWNPDFIITVGDNNYPNGEASTIDDNIGKYYHEFIYPYTGGYGAGAAGANKFFPTLGNHDVMIDPQPYLDYFTLPGNERYYDFVKGDIHFFAVNSNPGDPDGWDSTSVQAMWLKNALQSAPEKWKIVFFHHAPYSSDSYCGNTAYMQWPFRQWGASAVLTGHAHTYERIVNNGFPYFIDGMGGDYPSPNAFGTPVPGSVIRYSSDNGALQVTAVADSMVFSFISRANTLVDRYVLRAAPLFTEELRGREPTVLNAPNPFKESTEVMFIAAEAGNVELSVYGLTGIKLRTINWNNCRAGAQRLVWTNEGLDAGFYVYGIRVNGKWQGAGCCIITD